MTWILTIILIILLIIEIMMYLICHRYSKILKETYKYYPKIMKKLQEIACDYRVRVIKSGWGTKNIKSNYEESDDMGCFKIELTITDTEYINNLNKDLYYIYFRIYGKCYLAYSADELNTWSLVVSKARDESRALFGRTGYLDRHKI